MKIVIDIPDKIYNAFHKGNWSATYDGKKIRDIVMRGTSLPKGHGRILDEKDILDVKNNDGGWYDLVDMPEYIAGVKAIIEADKEYEAEVITRGNCMMCGKELTEGLFFCKECGDKANSGKRGG